MRILIFLAAFLLCLGSPIHLVLAGDFYVADNGSDTTGDGSQGNPWRSITKALTHVVTPGFTINVGPGTYATFSGEVFPIVLPNGVSLQGPQAGGAVVRMSGIGNMFEVNAHTAPTTIANLSMDMSAATGFGRVLDVNDQQAWLTVSNNLMLVRDSALNLDVFDSSLPGPTRVEFVDNTVIGAGNAFPDEALCGDLDARGQSYDILMAGNDVYGMGTGIQLHFSESGTLNLEVVDNAMIGLNGSAFYLHFSAWNSGTSKTAFTAVGQVNGMLDGNECRGLDRAASFTWEANDNAHLLVHAPIRYNRMDGYQFSAISFEVYAETTNSLAEASGFYGNSLVGNDVAVWAYFSNDGTSLALRPPDMGGGPAGVLMGRNTFLDSVDAVMEMNGDTGITMYAQGNWWGTTDLLEIEDLIEHFPDFSSEVLVDYANPLDMSLDVRLSRKKVVETGGTLVKVRAKPGSAFVPYTGDTKLEVTLGGNPVQLLGVNPKGNLIAFRSPYLGFTGPIMLEITNPNGTTVTKQMFSIP